jgi:NAD/NADP transhydrogenase beta subunit
MSGQVNVPAEEQVPHALLWIFMDDINGEVSQKDVVLAVGGEAVVNPAGRDLDVRTDRRDAVPERRRGRAW